MPESAAGTDSGTDAHATTASEGDADPDLPGSQRGRRGDEAELFEAYNRQLIRTIRSRVNTSQAIIEDACGYAWMQFMRYQPARDDGWKSWLLITAQREAWSLHRAEAGHVPLVSGRTSDDGRGGWELADLRHDRMNQAEAREALELLAQLPDRRRRAMELQVSGLTYDEIAATLGISHTRASP